MVFLAIFGIVVYDYRCKILKKDKLERGQKMKKKIGINILTIFVLLMTTKAVYANNARTVGTATTTQTVQSQNVVKEEATGQLIEMKEKELKSIENYNDKYGSEAYGMTAYLLDKVRIYSIPFAFVGIAIAAIYQYIIGVRKLDVRDRGFGVMIAIVTVFVICQVLPLVFAIVVRGFRG